MEKGEHNTLWILWRVNNMQRKRPGRKHREWLSLGDGHVVDLHDQVLYFVLSAISKFYTMSLTTFFFSLEGSLLINLLIRLHQVFAVACGIQFPNQGSNLGPLHWECSLSHWSTREVLHEPYYFYKKKKYLGKKSNKRVQLLLNPWNSDWGLNPPSFNWDLTQLVLGLKEAQVFDVSSQRKLSEARSDR